MTHQEQLIKAKQQKRIGDMSTRAILLHLTYKHRVILLIVSNAITLGLLVSRYI